jgi:hypothetical protein
MDGDTDSTPQNPDSISFGDCGEDPPAVEPESDRTSAVRLAENGRPTFSMPSAAAIADAIIRHSATGIRG